jgi:alkylhydroperoxidase family enzyme
MRVAVPADQADNPIGYVTSHYARPITAAAMAFSSITYEATCLSLREFEAARKRTADINGCMVCKGWRSARDVPDYLAMLGKADSRSVASDTSNPPDDAFYADTSEWRTSPLYSERERLAIEYAEKMGLEPDALAYNEGFWARLKAAFSDEEIVDLSYCIACWIGLGRVTHALGMDTQCSFAAAAE